MRRIKRPTENTYALGCAQTQSRRTKNCWYKAASGLPGSGWCW
jgi:hypothetical protein